MQNKTSLLNPFVNTAIKIFCRYSLSTQANSFRFAPYLYVPLPGQQPMLEKLRNKWKVSGIQLILILCTFAIGGSLCGYAGRKVLSLFPLEKGVLWVVIYIVVITLLWPLAVLLVSIPMGQFPFFKNYLARIGRRMRIIK
jgi:hypothetical protein